MGAHAVEVPGANGQAVSVDMPMRVLYPEYYPTLTRIYEEAGIATESLDYSGSFSCLDGEPIFRYRNYRLGNTALPFAHASDLLRPGTMKSTAIMGAKILTFMRKLPYYSHENREQHPNETLAEFIARVGLSSDITEKFLLPAYAGICTCSYINLLNYPARIILDYLDSGLMLSSMRRASLGVEDVVKRLSRHVHMLKLATPVDAIIRTEKSVVVVDKSGARESFDHVVLATQANHAIDILGRGSAAGNDSSAGNEQRIFAREQAILRSFDYEGFEVVIHRDARLAPGKPGWRSPVNFILSEGADAPMATIPLNNAHKALGKQPAVFQTWNPLVEPRQQDVFKTVKLFRPLINANSARAQRDIEKIHLEPDRNVWL